MWDWSASTIGFLLGIVFILIIILILYLSGAFIFKYCNTSNNTCSNCDYMSNPSEAVSSGMDIKDFLFYNEEHQMYYKRPPKKSCNPSHNQTIQINYPQVCQFTIDNEIYKGYQTSFNTPEYEVEYNSEKIKIRTDKHCHNPQNNKININRGISLLEWR